MGYYSDATLIVYPSEADPRIDDPVAAEKYKQDKMEALKVIIATTFKDGYDNHWGSDLEFHDDMMVLQLEGKLYDGYNFVESYKEMMRAMPELGYEYEYIRLGEETQDVECETSENASCHLHVHRYVEIG